MMQVGRIIELTEEQFNTEICQIKESHFLQENNSDIQWGQGIPQTFYRKGRVFNTSMEIRWEGGFYLKLFEEQIPEEKTGEDSGYWMVQGYSFDLWSPDDKRIPRPESEFPPFGKIKAVKYMRNGIAQFIRFKEVIKR